MDEGIDGLGVDSLDMGASSSGEEEDGYGRRPPLNNDDEIHAIGSTAGRWAFAWASQLLDAATAALFVVCCWIQPSVISVVYGAFATWLLVLRPSSPQLLRCCSAAGHQQDPVLHDEGSAETTVSFPRLIPTGTLVAVGAMVGRTVVRVHWGSGAPRWLVDYLGLDDR